MTTSSRPLVWVDLEMTGLDPASDRIVEIATVITDGQLNIVEEGPDLIVYQPPALLEGLSRTVREMHERSGLLAAVAASRVEIAEAEEQTLEFVRRHVAEARTAPLAGNSVHIDREFIERYMPRLAAFLHYRIVDVSTVKELARRWRPEVFEQAPTKAGGHRALADIRESIAELRYYRRTFFT